MKKINLFVLLSICGLFLFSCSSKQQEETKMLSSSCVKKSGTHSELLNIKGDSVKVMLVKINDKDWTLRALIPIENANPNPDPSIKPSMGNLSVEFIDANGSPIDFELHPEWHTVESVLSSSSIKTEDLLVKEAYSFTPDKYEVVKEKFDKIAGIALKEMTLTGGSGAFYSSGSSSSSGSSYSSDEDDDWDDVDLDDAMNAAKAATEALKATSEVMKSSKDMYKTAKKAEKQLKKMEDDDDWDW